MSFEVPGEKRYLVDVHNDYPWIANPRYGRFQLYVDGVYRCSIDPKSMKNVELGDSRQHSFQVRLWCWFRSPLLDVACAENKVSVVRANMPMEKSLLERMSSLMTHPFSALELRIEA